jgi:hypothetical protein
MPEFPTPFPTPSPSPSAPASARPTSLAGILARLGVAFACFALVGFALRAVAAPAGGSVIGGKLEYWQRHAREYDGVFLGSSHVLRAFVPSEFDAAMAAAGHPTRSFNFGVQAVHLLEQRHLLKAVLDAHPTLARVFFEYQWLTPQIDPQNAFDPRTVYWHDLETTGLALERTLHWGRELGDDFAFVEDESERHALFNVLDRALPPAVRAAEEHAQHGLTAHLSLGRGKDVVRGLLGRAHGQTARYRAQHGYLSLEEDERVLAAQGETRNTYSVRRERFLADIEGYRRAVDRLDADEVAFGDAEWVNAALTRVDDFELVARIAREVRARGVEFVLVILPSQSANRPFEERLLRELEALVLRYDLPEQYPALYDPALRYDSGHLSAEGAQHFSRLLARDYAARRGMTAAEETRREQRGPREGEGAPQ